MPRNLRDPEGSPELELTEPEQTEAVLPPEPWKRKREIRFPFRRSLRRRTAAHLQAGISPAALAGVQDALAAWKDAKHYFENVSDPELTGFAIYEMEAARRKYLYLLKNAHKID